jgi:hypothetical protein
VTIAQQIATPTPSARSRRPRAPLQTVPRSRRRSALVRVVVLMAATALGTALMAGAAAVAIMMAASSMGG